MHNCEWISGTATPNIYTFRFESVQIGRCGGRRFMVAESERNTKLSIGSASSSSWIFLFRHPLHQHNRHRSVHISEFSSSFTHITARIVIFTTHTHIRTFARDTKNSNTDFGPNTHTHTIHTSKVTNDHYILLEMKRFVFHNRNQNRSKWKKKRQTENRKYIRVRLAGTHVLEPPTTSIVHFLDAIHTWIGRHSFFFFKSFRRQRRRRFDKFSFFDKALKKCIPSDSSAISDET